MAYQYGQNQSDLVSYCNERIPGLMARVNYNRPITAQKAYIRKSLKGYCMHYLRDAAPLIRTPRGQLPTQVSELHENVKPILEHEELPEWVLQMIESRWYTKRFCNAYLRFRDT